MALISGWNLLKFTDFSYAKNSLSVIPKVNNETSTSIINTVVEGKFSFEDLRLDSDLPQMEWKPLWQYLHLHH